jgi:prevent-host-death family protein
MLLDMVERGEEIIITRDGKPVARLVPSATRIDKLQARAALERIRMRVSVSKQPFDWAAVRADRDAGRP